MSRTINYSSGALIKGTSGYIYLGDADHYVNHDTSTMHVSALECAGAVNAGNGSFADIDGDNLTLTAGCDISGDYTGVNYTGSGDVSAANLNASADITASGNVSAVDIAASGNMSAVDYSGSGNVSASGDITATGDMHYAALYTSGSLVVTGDVGGSDISASGDVTGVNAHLSGDLNAADATLSGDLNAAGATLTANLAAVDGAFSGDATVGGALSITGDATCSAFSAASGSFTNDIDATNATLSGNVQAVDGVFSGDVSGQAANFEGDVSGNNGSFADMTLAGELTAQNVLTTEFSCEEDAEFKHTTTRIETDDEMSALQSSAPTFQHSMSQHDMNVLALSNDGANQLKSIDLSMESQLSCDAFYSLEATIVAKKNDAAMSHAGAWKITAACGLVAGAASVVSYAIETLGISPNAASAGYDVSLSASGANIDIAGTSGTDNGDDEKVVWNIESKYAFVAMSPA